MVFWRKSYPSQLAGPNVHSNDAHQSKLHRFVQRSRERAHGIQKPDQRKYGADEVRPKYSAASVLVNEVIDEKK
eukprot:9485045-Pyramimonas_sp.AAC.2